MRRFVLPLALVALTTLPGCIAKTAYNVATAPVRVAAKGVDLATTSQSEADEKRGREIRKREEQLGKLERRYGKQLEECNEGDSDACEEARATYAEIQKILPTIPVDPEED